MSLLPDYIQPGVQILLVGINPGLRSARVGHHFAGHSNRFWKLLYEAHLVTEPLEYHDDWRLPEWRLGLTNMIPRPTAGSTELRPSEYQTSCDILKGKVETYRPPIIGLLGVTLGSMLKSRAQPKTKRAPSGQGSVKVGMQPYRFGGAHVFVLPNPSGRNAHYTYQDMLQLFQALQRCQQQIG